MTKRRYYNLSVKDMEEMKDTIIQIKTIITSDDFKKYLLLCCGKAVLKICQETLNEFRLVSQSEANANFLESTYMHSFNSEVKGDYICIYNNARVDVSEAAENNPNMDISKYPLKLSLAKIVEYGIGYTGDLLTDKEGVRQDWEYDVNEHGARGWYYIDKNGDKYWTNGYEGRLIFYKLKKVVKENISKWVKYYISKELKD